MQQIAWQVRAAPSRGGAVVATVEGDLDRTGREAFVAALTDLLVDHHRVVVDVSALRPQHASVVHAFTEAIERTGGWPSACLALAAPDPTLAALLTGSGVAHRVPVFADVAEAAAHLDDRPRLLRAWWRFTVDPHAPGLARAKVRDTCDRWGVGDQVREAAEIVVTELVTNSVEHATSASVVSVERRDTTLLMTVRDYGVGHRIPEAPSWVAPPTSSPRGRGLAMVAAVSREWGIRRHPDGTTIWAEMTPGSVGV
ncbi:ATP-binding protein [Actinomycetospora termitidis]|uniref:ATP-binding protein n=1 Tax=Actinomycetospora termitidis TaxID=3053470 RepID=A0ABT7MK41_9PSEU|nr:ATP-binding protein [Actinomycetospora sp. Odt1-22]MDL5160559.1 ATP-binding protein [Actinomycetospora sp. Odt1-22]